MQLFNRHKAGLENVDADAVEGRIHELSKDSSFFHDQERKQDAIDAKVARLLREKRLLLSTNTTMLSMSRTSTIERQLERWEQDRDLSQTYLCIDLDEFFAAVAMRDNPSLRGKPIAIGGKSMISTSSYEARKFGVRSAMPGWIGKQLCPDLILVRPDYGAYKRVGEQVRAIFAEYDPHFRSFSLDEATLNVTAVYEATQKSGADVAAEIRSKIAHVTQLTSSAGIGPTRTIAKIAADRNKPNGQFVVEPAHGRDFIQSLPLRKLPGVGKQTERLVCGVLESDEVTCGDVTRPENAYVIQQLLKPKTSQWLLRACLGLEEASGVVVDEDEDAAADDSKKSKSERQSVSRERTFRTTCDIPSLHRHLGTVASLVAADLDKLGLSGSSMTLKTKTDAFAVHQVSRSGWNHRVERLEDVAADLLREHVRANPNTRYRLLGLRVSDLFSHKAEERAREMFGGGDTASSIAKCPLCGAVLAGARSLQNKHVDACLSRQQEQQHVAEKKKKKGDAELVLQSEEQQPKKDVNSPARKRRKRSKRRPPPQVPTL